MKKRQPAEQPIDPAELAAGYMFPELFTDAPFNLISQEATERPFVPSTAVQYTIPGLPPVDWEHIRKQAAERRRQRRARRTPATTPIYTAEAPDEDSQP